MLNEAKLYFAASNFCRIRAKSFFSGISTVQISRIIMFRNNVYNSFYIAWWFVSCNGIQKGFKNYCPSIKIEMKAEVAHCEERKLVIDVKISHMQNPCLQVTNNPGCQLPVFNEVCAATYDEKISSSCNSSGHYHIAIPFENSTSCVVYVYSKTFQRLDNCSLTINASIFSSCLNYLNISGLNANATLNATQYSVSRFSTSNVVSIIALLGLLLVIAAFFIIRKLRFRHTSRPTYFTLSSFHD